MKYMIIIAGVLAASSAGALAQSSSYIAGGIGSVKVKDDIGSFSSQSGGLSYTRSADTRGSGLGLLLGHEFSSRWSIEAGYLNIRSLSATESLVATNAVVGGNTYNGSISAKQDISGYALTLAPRLTHRIGALDLFAKAGLAHVKVQNELTLSGAGTVNGSPIAVGSKQTYRDNSTVPMLGLGAQFNVAGNLGIRGDYTYINKVGDRATTGESSIQLFMLSGVYRF